MSSPAGGKPNRLQSTDALPVRSYAVPTSEWIPIVVLFVTFATFLPALGNQFIDPGGGPLTTGSPGFGDRESAIHSQTLPYWPILWATFEFDRSLWWMDPFGYQLTNLLLQTAAAIVVYPVVSSLIFSARVFDGGHSGAGAKLAAAFATLILALHPLRVEPVAFLPARAELASGFWALLSMYGYLRTKAAGENATSFTPWSLFSIVAYGCSLLSGPSGYALPVVLLLLDVYPLRRAERFPSIFRADERNLYSEKTPYFVVAFCFAVFILLPGIQNTAVMESYAQVRARGLSEDVRWPRKFVRDLPTLLLDSRVISTHRALDKPRADNDPRHQRFFRAVAINSQPFHAHPSAAD